MQKVITVNLNGNAYQLDENALDALRAYLDAADAQLAGNPDKAEIMADLEQAIGEKCLRFLGPHKTVVAAKEIAQVLTEMGPVDGGHAGAAGGERTSGDPAGPGVRTPRSAPRRLYRIREGAMIGGVCNGTAAFFNLDPTIVRLMFVVLLVISGGGFGVAYLVLMWVIPVATTSEEHAAAQGAPFTAQELVDEAKKNYAEFKDKHWDQKQWKWEWRRQRREMRRQWRQWRQARRAGWSPAPVPPAGAYASPVTHGLLAPIAGVITALLSIGLVVAILSVLRSGAVLGYPLPDGVPNWVGIVALVIIYRVVVTPFRFMYGGWWHHGYGPYWHPGADVLMALIWMGCWALVFWYAYLHLPELRNSLQHLLSWAPGVGVRI